MPNKIRIALMLVFFLELIAFSFPNKFRGQASAFFAGAMFYWLISELEKESQR
ncbi:hypothetical protein [Thermococcus barophilus]|nr:hypothetical protein [Thermococcus barophilus]